MKAISADALPCARCIGRHLNLCRPLDDGRLARLLSFGGPRQWASSETLFRAGAPVGSFFKIRSGIVAVSRLLDDGRRQVVALRAPGDCVGYLEEDGDYAFEGRALTDVDACAFNRRQFDMFMAENPDLAAAMGEELSRVLKQTGQAMVVLGQFKSTERVAHFLVEIEALFREREVAVSPLSLVMSRSEIADYLGLTVETVSRAFTRLKNQGVIKTIGKAEIVILDRPKLREIAKA